MRKVIAVFLLAISNILPGLCEQISFDSFLLEAEKNSFQLQTDKLNMDYAKAGTKGARSDYFPTVGIFATAERYNDLTDGDSQLTAVGSDIFLNRSYYQNVAGAGLSYNLFDFGIRRNKLNISKLDETQRKNVHDRDLRNLKIDIADLYAQALLFYKEFCTKRDILAIQNELYEINSKLKVAGEISEVNVTDEAIKVSELQTDIDELRNNLGKKLSEFSYYTKKTYDIDELELKDFPYDSDGFVSVSNGVLNLRIEENVILPENSLEYKIYNIEIEKKQKEYEAQKRANYPKLRFDTRYSFYGSDKNNLFTSIGDLSQRGLNLRLSTSFLLFDGMKNRAQIEKLKIDIEKLKVEKEKSIAELVKKYSQIQQDSANSIIQFRNNTKTLTLVNKNLDALERLNANGVVGRSDYLKRKMALLEKKLVLEQNQVRSFQAQYKLKVLNNEDLKIEEKVNL